MVFIQTSPEHPVGDGIDVIGYVQEVWFEEDNEWGQHHKMRIKAFHDDWTIEGSVPKAARDQDLDLEGEVIKLRCNIYGSGTDLYRGYFKRPRKFQLVKDPWVLNPTCNDCGKLLENNIHRICPDCEGLPF